ncbi:smoothelin-like protein 1 [Montipora foliosa]|uniref:smoothelin-like protein 1 n=1 Tax=Montipora foliosa TaxID=591990 RepID=UPI0035F10959
MATFEEIHRQESALKQKLEGTKNITERRKLRAELRELKEKKEKLTDENGNITKAPSMASKFTMSVNSAEKERYQERAIIIKRDESPARKENVAPPQSKYTRSTFNFKVANTDDKTSESNLNRRHIKSSLEEKQRKNQDLKINHNADLKPEKDNEDGEPKRMSRRSSLAELFKLDQCRSREQSPSSASHVTGTSTPMVHHRLPVETQQDTKTKQDLMQNLGRLRGRRRSVREIEKKDELDGLMYVKSGDTVKLVSTSEGDEQVKEHRKIRRSSRKESHEKLKIEDNTISSRSETELAAIQESPRTPKDSPHFGFTKQEPPKTEEPPKTRIWQPPPRTDAPKPASSGRQWSNPAALSQKPTRPNSFLPSKNEGAKFGQKGGMGSVKDRMAFFKKAEEDEKKAKEKQFTQKKPPTPTSVNRFSAPSPTSPTSSAGLTSPATTTEKVSLKKAPDPNKTPRDLKKKPQLKRQMSVSSLILTWCKDVTQGYEGVNITNFSGSFSNGLAFCALIHKFNPDKFDYTSLSAENREYNFQLAFDTGESVGIPALLDVEDMIRLKKPEPRSVQCYVQMIFSKYRPKDLDMSNLIIA